MEHHRPGRGAHADGPAWPMYEGRPLADPTEPVFDQGLAFDLETVVTRRRLLAAMGFGGLFIVAGCAPAASGLLSPGPSAAASASDGTSCDLIPEETAGPFPGDGSNGPDVLSQSGVVRSDIRTSFGDMSGTAEGIPLTIRLALQDATAGCAPLAGAAAYVWHCDREGRYSLYSDGATDQNYLRGVQGSAGDGIVTFRSIFPACYQGRWPHVHFEVYPSLDKATDDANVVATSQIALPEDISRAVYATAGYEQSVTNMAGMTLATDGVFGDTGGLSQLGTMSGSITDGLVVELAVPVGTA